MVVYVGRLGVQYWVDREVRVGLELNTRDPYRFKLIPVLGDGADVTRLPPFLRQHQGIRADDPHAIRRLVETLHGQGGPAVPATYWATHSPFRSLHAFEPEDAWLFFGRDHEVGELLDRVARARVQIVIGNSGSGKSSLIRAGLIPALQRGRLQSNGHAVERWRIAMFRPGSDPFGELVDRLPGQLAPAPAPAERDALITRWRETFPGGANAVRNGVAALSTDHSRTLLFADQFEELFTTGTDHDVQQRYIDALLKTTEAEGVHLIIGVRADFYANCLQHPSLKPHLQGNYSVLLMHPDQLHEAVEKRLALAAAHAEPERSTCPAVTSSSEGTMGPSLSRSHLWTGRPRTGSPSTTFSRASLIRTRTSNASIAAIGRRSSTPISLSRPRSSRRSRTPGSESTTANGPTTALAGCRRSRFRARLSSGDQSPLKLST
jgi:hypothetical protein